MSEIPAQAVTPAPSAPAPVAPVVSTPAPEAPAVKPAEAAPEAPATQGDKPAAPVDKPVEGEKPAEPPAKVVPEKYELKLSENSLGDAALIERVADYAKSQGLSQDEAAALLVDQEKMVTTLVENQIPDTMKARSMTREQVINDVLLAAQPTKQFVKIEDVAGIALFLTTPAADQINGASLSVDGGWTAQ